MSPPLSIFAAARESDAAIALETAERSLTFGELAELTLTRLTTIDDAGDNRPYPVIGHNTLDTIVTLYALWERGIAPLLVHPRLTPAERATLLERARSSPALGVPDAAAVLHTSGTTGTPRAAILTHAALEASAAANAANMGWVDDDRWLLCMPLGHVGGLSIVSRCLIARKCVVLAESFEPERMPAFMHQHGVTLVSLVPTMLTRLLDAAWTPSPRLRAVLLGGAAAGRNVLARASAQRIPVLVTYGLTETCSQVATTPYALRHEPLAYGVGKPLPGIDVRVRDDQLEVRGPVLMAGYWNERLLARGEWFGTGDVGCIDDAGFIHVRARRHDLIITGGENVSPVEVENVLEECPGVRAAGVFGVPDELWGQIVVAAVVARDAATARSALEAHIAAQLAPHKRPRQIVFVNELPHTRGGKLDRAALPGLAQAARSRDAVSSR